MTAVKHEWRKHEKGIVLSEAAGGAGYGAEHEVPLCWRRFGSRSSIRAV